MARGITQEQVNTAADALLLAGERPTIERVRAALGTGSPNTLIRLLDVWWATVGRRLAAQERRLAMPNAPDNVAHAAGALWSLALEHAMEAVAAQVANERAQLAASQSTVQNQVVDILAAHDRALAAALAADTERDRALARVVDLERLVTHQTQQLLDLTHQRDELARDCDALKNRTNALEQELREAVAGASAERALQQDRHRISEDRWLQEVDRARQDSARLQATLHQRDKELRRVGDDLAKQRQRLSASERDHAAMAARLSASGVEIDRLHQLLAATAPKTTGKSKSRSATPAQSAPARLQKRRKGTAASSG